MPNRIIKESIHTSDTLAAISADAERLFWRLVTAADDYGRFHARPHIVLGKCLAAFVGRVTAERVAVWLNELASVDLIRRYQVDGKLFLQLTTWAEHQRPPRAQNPKFPPMPESDDTCGQVTADDSGCPQVSEDAPVSGIRDSGFANRDSGGERHPPSADDVPPLDCTTEEREILHQLKQVTAYPFDWKRDLEHVRSLSVDYPQIDLLDEVKRWRTYKLDNPLTAKSNARSQFRQWCGKAVSFGRSRASPSVPSKEPPSPSYHRKFGTPENYQPPPGVTYED